MNNGADPGSEADHVEIGVVARAHGIRGELRVHLHNPDSTALGRAEEILIGGQPHEVQAARPVAGAYLVKLAAVPDRTAAEGLRGQPVAVHRDDLDLDDGEVLLADLVGCQVELPDGTPWGTIHHIEPGPQDRLVIHHGDIERLLPLVDELIVSIDIEQHRVVIDPPDGIPEDPIRRR